MADLSGLRGAALLLAGTMAGKVADATGSKVAARVFEKIDAKIEELGKEG